MLIPQDFFDLQNCSYQELFVNDEPVWTALDRLQDYISTFFRDSWLMTGISGQIKKSLVIHNGEIYDDLELRATGPKGSIQAYRLGAPLQGASIILPGAHLLDDKIIIGSGTVIEPGALVKGPVIFGNDTEIRQGAYVRGDCLVADGCVVGHATEIKGSVMLDGAKAGHFAYIGDSILGNGVNLGAGTKLANLRMISGTITIVSGKQRYKTGRRKIGAILGDKTETGCNSVTSPGTLLGPHSIVYPCVSVPGGNYPKGSIILPSRDSIRIKC